jgi:hypothetical protein
MRKLSRGALYVSLTLAACLCGVEKARAQEPFTDIGAGLTGVTGCLDPGARIPQGGRDTEYEFLRREAAVKDSG